MRENWACDTRNRGYGSKKSGEARNMGKKDVGSCEFQRPKLRRWSGSGSGPGDNMVDTDFYQLTLSDSK